MRLKFTLLCIFIATAFPALAIDFIATNVYTVAAETVVDEEQWIVAGLAETAGIYKNDLNIATGNPLILNGTYQGNLSAMASMEASMVGTAERNVRLLATTVRIDGPVAGNVMAMGGTVVIGTNAVIQGDVIIFANSVVQEGLVKGDTTISGIDPYPDGEPIACGVVTLAGRVEGDVKIASQEILVTRDAKLLGNFDYQAPKELYLDEGVVAGEVLRVLSPSLFTLDRLKMIGIWFLAAFLVGVPFISLFPMTTAMAAQLVRHSPWKCFATGLLAVIALPALGAMCISSLIGIPLGVLLLGSWAILLYLSRIIIGLVIGTLILRTLGQSIGKVLVAMALGLALIYLSTVAPSIGAPVQILVVCLGMGSLILSLIGKRRLILQVPANLKKLEELKNEKYNPKEK